MEQRLRFTGEWPPLDLWEKYPNWEPALDEEGFEGQDESTIKPAEIQDVIPNIVMWSLGQVTQANGECKPAYLLFQGDYGPSQIDVVISDRLSWAMWFDERNRRWWLYNPEWLDQEVRQVTPKLEDAKVFPMRIASRLPLASSGIPYVFVINPDGAESEATLTS